MTTRRQWRKQHGGHDSQGVCGHSRALLHLFTRARGIRNTNAIRKQTRVWLRAFNKCNCKTTRPCRGRRESTPRATPVEWVGVLAACTWHQKSLHVTNAFCGPALLFQVLAKWHYVPVVPWSPPTQIGSVLHPRLTLPLYFLITLEASHGKIVKDGCCSLTSSFWNLPQDNKQAVEIHRLVIVFFFFLF